jgi:hypothetical protein
MTEDVSTKAVFEVYNKNRPEVPSIEATASGAVSFNPNEIEEDKRIEGYENLIEFLDETKETEVVEHPEYGESEVEMNQYRWIEVGVESAPVHTICSTCGAKVQTSSQQLIEEKRNTHHISTGH